MAGEWIPIRTDLHEDPAVIAIAAAVGLDEYSVVGRLCRLWSWANRQLVDGHARCVDAVWIDRYLATPGFAAAMLDAGWLRLRSGGVEFPNFDRWNSQGAKRRLSKTQWQQRERASPPEDKVKTPKRSACGHRKSSKSPPEERRVEEKEKDRKPLPPPLADGVGKKPRPPNPLFDAVAEVSGLDPATAGAKIGTVAAALARAAPPYTPDDVREFGRRFWEVCPWAAKDSRTRPTPFEIKDQIGLLRSGPQSGGLFDAADRRPRGDVRRAGRAEPEPGEYDAFRRPDPAGEGAGPPGVEEGGPPGRPA